MNLVAIRAVKHMQRNLLGGGVTWCPGHNDNTSRSPHGQRCHVAQNIVARRAIHEHGNFLAKRLERALAFLIEAIGITGCEQQTQMA